MNSAAWADNTKLVGKEDNTNDFWAGTLSDIYDIAPNKTLKLEFTSYIKDAGWNVWEAWVSQFWDLNEKNVFVRADGYGWQAGDGGKNTNPYDANTNTAGYDPANPWFSYNAANYPTGNDFHTALQEASVVYTFKRINAEVIITQEVTKGSNTYKHEFVCFFGDGTRNISVQLATDHSHIIIDNDKTTITDSEIPVITGTLLGCLSQRGRFGAGQREDFTLKADASMTLHFKNYTSKLNNWSNWNLELQKGSDYLDLRSDNFGWGAYWNSASCTISTGYLDSFTEKMDGADVVMTITRNGSNLIIVVTHTPKVGDAFTETYNYTNDALTSGDVTVRLLTECAYLDLLPVTKTMTAAGWATYCSPYALDFTNDIANLTDVYIITGGDGSHVTTTSVKGGTVPANTGLLLKGTAGDINIPIVGTSTTDVSGNKLIGKTESYNLAANGGYVLMASPSVGFYKNTNAFTVGANTAYLPANFDGAGARSFFSLDDETTGINMVNGEGLKVNGSEVYYDLQGRRVLYPTKGLYIVNGMKVVIK